VKEYGKKEKKKEQGERWVKEQHRRLLKEVWNPDGMSVKPSSQQTELCGRKRTTLEMPGVEDGGQGRLISAFYFTRALPDDIATAEFVGPAPGKQKLPSLPLPSLILSLPEPPPCYLIQSFLP
jgi:hypothetical protein